MPVYNKPTIQTTGNLSGNGRVDNPVVLKDNINLSQVTASDLKITGTASIAQLNTLNQTELLVGDKYIVIMSGGIDHIDLNGSGILWGSGSSGTTTGSRGENANILFNGTADRLEIFPGLSASFVSGAFVGDLTGTASYATNAQTASYLNPLIQDAFLTGAFAQGWRSSASGVYSHAEGSDTLASNNYSHAEGEGTIASGQYSHAEGYQTEAGGDGFNHAEGDTTIATGDSAHAEGRQTQAAGRASHAEGYRTLASGLYSHAEGSSLTASGNNSHAEGARNIAQGASSHAEGFHTLASNNGSHAEGYYATASGQYSHAEGNNGLASGDYSHAEGMYTIASGLGSHAEGGYYFFGGVYTGSTASGQGSHAEGQATLASGFFSHTEGNITLASGPYSHAEGYRTSASGYSSHSEGYFTEAIADSSHTEGYYAKAYGGSSHAEGSQTTAYGHSSHAEGDQTQTSGSASHTEGRYTTTTGSYSHAEGLSTTAAGYASHAEGQETKTFGDFSHAEGYLTKASGSNSHAEGHGTITSGSYSHAEGINTKTIGSYSHAEGVSTISTGQASHAEGKNTNTIGDFSHAEGAGSQAVGDYSHAEGYNTYAVGNYSHAEGQETIASGAYQSVVGKFNSRNNTTSLFVVGNGLDNSSRSDILSVNQYNVIVSGSVVVSGTLSANSYITGTFIGNGAGLTGVTTSTSFPYVIYVSSGSSGVGADGSLTKPFNNIQAALNYASSSYTNFSQGVLVNIAPGTYTENITISRHNTYLKSNLSKNEQRGVQIVGSTIVSCSAAPSKYNHVVGLDGIFFGSGDSTVTASVNVLSPGSYSVYLKDCYLYTSKVGVSALRTSGSVADKKILIKDCFFATTAVGSFAANILNFQGGDVKIDTAQIETSSSILNTSVGMNIGGDSIILADRMYINQASNGYGINNDSTYATSLSNPFTLTLSNSSINTIGSTIIYTNSNAYLTNNILLGSGVPYIGGASPATFVYYSELIGLTEFPAFYGVTKVATYQTHGNVNANTLSGTLNVSYLTGTLPVNKGGTGATTFTSGSYLVGDTANSIKTRTAAQVTADLSLFSTTSTAKGLVTGSNNVGNNYFLRADGAWALKPYGQFTISGSQIYSSAGGIISGFSQDMSSSISVSAGSFTFSETGRYLVSITGRLAATTVTDTPSALKIETRFGETSIDTIYASSEVNAITAGNSYIISRTELIDVNTIAKQVDFYATVIGGTSITGSWENVGGPDGNFGHNLKVVMTKI